jgi:L-rhamnose mutarotase
MKKRYCLTLDLKDDPELIRQYIYWHRPENIWPEIPRGIRESGIDEMDIYLRGTRMFMIVEADASVDFDQAMKKMATLPRQPEWAAFVAKFQQQLPDAKGEEKWMMMEQVFTLPA